MTKGFLVFRIQEQQDRRVVTAKYSKTAQAPHKQQNE